MKHDLPVRGCWVAALAPTPTSPPQNLDGAISRDAVVLPTDLRRTYKLQSLKL